MKSRLLLIAYALSGTAALAYELGWLRELSAMLGATAYASGIMLGAYMLGLGIGALLGTWLAQRVKTALVAASRVELAIAAFSIIAFLGIRFLPAYYFNWMREAGTGSPAGFLTLQFVTCFIVMVLPTIAMGMTYPLVMKAVGRDQSIGSLSAKLYAVNTVGAIVGSLVAAFVLLPSIGVKGTLIVAALLSVLVSALIRSIADKKVDLLAFAKSPEIAIAIAILVVLAIIPARSGSPLGLGQAFYYRSAEEFARVSGKRETIYDREGLYSRVQVIQDADGSLRLFNGALDEGTDNNYDRVTTTMIAAVPAMSVDEHETALVVGLGTGYTSLTYRILGFGQTTTVEINPEVLPASEFFIGSIDDDAARWHVVVDDARAFILTSSEKYDAISSEPSWPWSSGVAALFTEEFMQAAQSRLQPHGVYCQWLPNYLLNFEDVAMLYKTMRQVFERVDVRAINFPDAADAELLLIGYNNVDGLSQEQVKERLDDLIESGIFDNEFIVPECITPFSQAEALEAAMIDPAVPLNTDDHSTLEYRVFWNFVTRAFAPATGTGID
jgi:spermidine synthase